MNPPRDRSAKIDGKRIHRWLAQFAGYYNPVTRFTIDAWLQQFHSSDRNLAARLLDSVLFLGQGHIHTCYRNLLEGISGWDYRASKRRGKWFFVPFSGSVGKSGDTMVHMFRMATQLNKRQFDNLFFHRSDLVLARPGPDDTVVLLDDFSGTGKQACESWRDIFAELLTNGPRVILMLVSATKTAITRIRAETSMEPLCGTPLSEKDDIFHSDCQYFNSDEKSTVLKYCKRADQKNPKGFGECGLFIVFAHRCPNNTIPIFHAFHNNWEGLFPRHV